MNVWTVLIMVLLALGLIIPFWVLLQFALVGDKTRDEIHGDE